MSGVPETPPEAWLGEEPAEGTRRAAIRDTIAAYPVGEGSLADNSLGLADAIEIALQSAAAQPSSPDLEDAPPFSLEELHAQLAATSDYERGRLLELVGGAAGVVGSLTRHAADQLEGFPADVKVAALLLLAVGIVDQAGPID